MSRGIVSLCLLAVISGPLIGLDGSAERLAETLSEQFQTHILEPGDDAADCACSDLSASPHDHRLDVDISPVVGPAFGRFQPLSDLILWSPCSGPRVEDSGWPGPDGSRRRSWLQVFRN